jgi:acyl-CoA dehydrogenase
MKCVDLDRVRVCLSLLCVLQHSTHTGGLITALHGSQGIGLPPIIAHGSDELKQRVLPQLIRGEKLIALALTEPWVGSDLAQLQTTAVRDGDVYVVNGAKKFITGGGYADYFTTAVRTGTDG